MSFRSSAAVSEASELSNEQKERALRNKANALTIRVKKLVEEKEELQKELAAEQQMKVDLEDRLASEESMREADLQDFEARTNELKSTLENVRAELEFFRNRFYSHGV